MTDYNYNYRTIGEPTAPIDRSNKTTKQTNNNKKVIAFFLSVIIWMGLLYGGYNYTQKSLHNVQTAFQQDVLTVKTANQESMLVLLGEINSLQGELLEVSQELSLVKEQLGFIKEELQLTGETMTGSDQSKQALTSRIADLDKQLAQLRNQLKKLEEAALVY